MKNIFLAVAFMLMTPISFSAQTTKTAAQVAVESKSRTADDIKADDHRHPQELLDFSKAKAGDTVVDLLPGKGYFTRLFSSVVGDKGHVIAFVPKELEAAKFKPVDAAHKAIEGLKNAEVKVTPILQTAAENVDVIWTSQNYHDLHIKSLIDVDMAAYNKVIFKMLKPGGYFIVVDHVAAAGASVADIERLHRIDPAFAKKEIEAAGFILDEESHVLAQKEDHTLNVFDPAIRGKTDQFIYRFVKPKKK